MSAKIQVVPSLDGFANGDHVVTTLNGYIYTGVVKQLAIAVRNKSNPRGCASTEAMPHGTTSRIYVMQIQTITAVFEREN